MTNLLSTENEGGTRGDSEPQDESYIDWEASVLYPPALQPSETPWVELEPGKLEAIARGCLCPMRREDDFGAAYINQECPLHGYKTIPEEEPYA